MTATAGMDWHNPRHWQHHVHLEWRHARRFRSCLLTVLACVLLIGSIPYFLSFDTLKQFLVSSLSADTGRTLRIDGRARAVLLPRPALLLEQVSLSEPNRPDETFALADSLEARLDLWSLLRGKPKLRELEIERPELRIRRDREGAFNFDDLLRLEGSGIRVALNVVRFNDMRMRISDEFTRQTFSSSALDVSLENLSDPKNGRLTMNGIVQVGPDEKTRLWQGILTANAAMRYSEKERRLRIADLQIDVQQEGASAPSLQLKDTKVSMLGNLDFSWNPLRFVGGDLKVTSSGKRAEQNWTGELVVPEIRIANGVLALHRLKMLVNMKSQAGRFLAAFEVPTLAGTQQGILRTDAARIQVELGSPQQTLALNFSSPLEVHNGSLLRLPDYRLQGNYSNRSLPRGAIPFDLQGRGELDLGSETLYFDNAGALDNSPFNARIGIENFVNPAYSVDLGVDRLDLSPYLPAVTEGAKTADQDSPFDFWWLERMNATGSIRIGELVLQKMHINDLAFRLHASDRKLVLDPLAARLYGGRLSGRLELDTSKPEATVRVQQTLSRMDINALLNDLLDTRRFEGFGSLQLDVAAVGDRMSDFRRTAGGSVHMQLSKGAIRGVDFPAALRVINQQIKALNGEPVDFSRLNAATSFSELNAGFVLRHGVATNSDMSIDAGIVKLRGNGVVDFAAGEIDYLINASPNPQVPELAGLRGMTVPVSVRGPLATPRYEVDYASLREQVEKQQAAALAKPPLKAAGSKKN
ncbi:AsmA family protein [Chitinilyticum piscinae]|uniref:AsmA family protein n=1 Tax=Chitinilyticum piscinae TaxID=2866724 RepID=A0A8J7KBP1_9NEIS|nr:AsmA family protein [Chitinilyticum piscinae]MBE9610429.1 AsmA family protein [Chitinilyticum piscinae]